MAYTFLAAKGYQVGTSLLEANQIETVKGYLAQAEKAGVEIVLPTDVVVADTFTADSPHDVVPADAIPAGRTGLDIGPDSAKLFASKIADAKTIVWNGPMGVFEMKPFEAGTREVAVAVARNNKAVSVIGGGDSVAALKKFGLEERVTFVSTGGGASMKLLEGVPLPGVEALKDTLG